MVGAERLLLLDLFLLFLLHILLQLFGLFHSALVQPDSIVDFARVLCGQAPLHLYALLLGLLFLFFLFLLFQKLLFGVAE